jgi:hypothetical protein
MQECTNAGMRRRRKAVCAVVHLCVCAFLASGCMRARANTLPSGPPLDVPAPPPRIVVPLEAAVPPAQPVPPEEPRRAPTPTPVPPAARPRPGAAAPADAPKVVEEPPKPVPTAPPASTTTLQTTPAAEQGEVERGIRATMARATADLNRVDYRALNADARTQYDTAKRFIQQADEAIAMKNLPFAKTVADKAAVLAAQLSGR